MAERNRRPLLCPRCRRLVSADESKCPHCGLSRPGARWKSSPVGQIFFGQDHLIRYLVYFNIAFYVISLLMNPRGTGLSANPLRMLSPDSQSLLLLGATGTVPIDRLGRWWTLLSANYLHGGILHLFFNMMAVGQVAPLVLREYGGHRFVAIYTLGGVCGFYVSYLFGVALTIGASAALCALIGAAMYYGWHRGGVYGQAIYRQLGGWAIAIFVFGFVVPGINNWGHGGGFLAGALLGMLLGYSERRPVNPVHRLLAAACVLITGAVLLWALGSGFYYRFVQ